MGRTIVLIGFMGSGKSTLGRRLAHRMNRSFVDLDQYVESKHQLSVSGIFEQFGENQFRLWEREALLEVLQQENAILAAGGGTPCFFDNMEQMNQHGLTVYLYLEPAVLLHRLVHTPNIRPAVKGMNREELASFVNQKLEERSPFYEQANLQIDALNLNFDRVLEMIAWSMRTSR